MPVPSQNPDESGFVIGMHKFSNIVLDLSSLEMSFVCLAHDATVNVLTC